MQIGEAVAVETPLGWLVARKCGSDLYPGIEIKCNGVRVAMVEYTDTFARIQTIVHSSPEESNDFVEDRDGQCGIVPYQVG